MMLIRRIERFIHRSGVSASTLGRRALGDPRFVHDLRNGRQPRPETLARLKAWLEREEQRSCR
jgi:hypothetical protein